MTKKNEKLQEISENAILGCAKWCCNRHNRYGRDFLVQIGLVDRLRGVRWRRKTPRQVAGLIFGGLYGNYERLLQKWLLSWWGEINRADESQG